MQKEKVDVKTKGKVIGQVEVQQFDSVEEAVKTLGAERVKSLINQQHRSNTMNEFRAAQTRDVSPVSKLAKLAKGNPELEKQIKGLLAKYGVSDAA